MLSDWLRMPRYSTEVFLFFVAFLASLLSFHMLLLQIVNFYGFISYLLPVLLVPFSDVSLMVSLLFINCIKDTYYLEYVLMLYIFHMLSVVT